MFRLADILQIAAVTPSVVIFLFLLYVSQMFGYFCLRFCFFLVSFLAKYVFFFRHCVQLYQYDGNPSPGILGFVLFLKITLYCSSPIRISQKSSKADCEELVVGALIQSSSLSTIQQSNKYTTDMMCLGFPNYMFLRLCSLFIADSEM